MANRVATLKYLKLKAWGLISAYIRTREIDELSRTQCYTCGKLRNWRELHCGHYIHGKLDFDERNLKPQCVHCNTYLHGNLGVYSERLLNENGQEWLKQLRLDGFKKGNNYTREEVLEVIKKYGTKKN